MNDAALDLRGVYEENLKLRSQVKAVMKEWAAEDADRCPLEKIGQALIDLHADNQRQHHRRQLAEDGSGHELTKVNAGLRLSLEEAGKTHIQSVEQYEAVTKMLREQINQYEKAVCSLSEKLDTANAEKDALKNSVIVTLHDTLMRPDGFCEVYGEEGYMHVRNLYGKISGEDFDGIPMPKSVKKPSRPV